MTPPYDVPEMAKSVFGVALVSRPKSYRLEPLDRNGGLETTATTTASKIESNSIRPPGFLA